LNFVQPADHSESPLASAASQWLARRDRGLSPAEQDAYLQWLRESPARGLEIVRLEKTWSRLNALQQWRPAHAAQANPDLLALPQRPARRRRWRPVLAAAAALAIAATAWQVCLPREKIAPSPAAASLPRTLTLADGSLVELKADAQVAVDFNATTRHVRLLRGEAYFVVAKDPSRPFVVAAERFAVRAVGTAFAVQTDAEATSVVVIEGKVQLGEMPSRTDGAVFARELSPLKAGQQAVARAASDGSGRVRLEIHDMSTGEIDAALAWQTMRLQFDAVPLREVVAQFNRYHSRKLVIEDEATAAIVVGGSFRADNLEPFVRLLDVGFGVSAEVRGDEIALRRR
jgi:transmembrane sensor